ncbi:MAG: hypothetical protein ACTHK7_08105 [Aureliella sp.]
MTTRWRQVGRVIQILDIELRGLALLIDLKLSDFPSDLEIRIGDRVRISQGDGRQVDTQVCGVELRPLLTLLLPLGTDWQGMIGATVALSPSETHEP